MSAHPAEASLVVVVADDHPIIREAVAQTLRRALETVEVLEAGTFDEACKLLEARDRVDLVTLDLDMPGMDGFSGLAVLRGRFPRVPVAIVSGTGNGGVMRQAIALGASAFVPKSVAIEAIGEAVRAVLAGQVWLPADIDDEPETALPESARRIAELTPQQMRVLSLVAEGKLNKQIAYEMGIGEQTVKAHMSAVLKKLGANNRTQAVLALRQFTLAGKS